MSEEPREGRPPAEESLHDTLSLVGELQPHEAEQARLQREIRASSRVAKPRSPTVWRRAKVATGDLWGGLAAAAVVLPQAMAFGVALFVPAGLPASSGAIAGLIGAEAPPHIWVDNNGNPIVFDGLDNSDYLLGEGPSHRAVRASVGIPGVMSPTRIDDRWLLDGGLVNPVPVSAARALGADVIISVNPNARRHGKIWMAPDPKPAAPWLARLLPEALHDPLGIDPEPAAKEVTPNYFAVVSASLDIMSDTIRRARMAGDPPHIALEAHITDLTVLELYRGAEAIAEGERIVLAQAEAIREVCGLA